MFSRLLNLYGKVIIETAVLVNKTILRKSAKTLQKIRKFSLFLRLNLDNSFGLDVRRESDYFLPLPVPEAIHNKHLSKIIYIFCSLQSWYNKEQFDSLCKHIILIDFFTFYNVLPVLTSKVGTKNFFFSQISTIQNVQEVLYTHCIKWTRLLGHVVEVFHQNALNGDFKKGQTFKQEL